VFDRVTSLPRPCDVIVMCEEFSSAIVAVLSLPEWRSASGSSDIFTDCLAQWFPTGGSQPQSGRCNSLLKSEFFVAAHIDSVCYISKTETLSDLCEVHITSIIIPIWFLLYSFNWPDCRKESCERWLNLMDCGNPHLRGWSGLNLMRGGRGMINFCAGNWMLSKSTLI